MEMSWGEIFGPTNPDNISTTFDTAYYVKVSDWLKLFIVVST